MASPWTPRPPTASRPTAALIWIGNIATDEVVAYDQSGIDLAGLRAMEFISQTELAVATTDGANIEFYDPVHGAFVRSIPPATTPLELEGLAWDGEIFW
jgi:hypothetical protein